MSVGAQWNAPRGEQVYDAFCTKIKSINASRGEAFQLKTPSLDTFRSWIRKMDRYEVALKRHGETVARKCAGYAAALDRAIRPLEIVEVDHTPIDLQLLFEITGIPAAAPGSPSWSKSTAGQSSVSISASIRRAICQ
jgi:hypothetical protein